MAKRRPFLSAIFVAFLLMCGTTTGVHGADTDGRVSVAVFDIAPWGERADDGSLRGVTVDMFNAISERSGIAFDFHLRPYQRMLVELETGAIDASLFYRSRKSEAIAIPLAFVHDEKNIVVGLKGTNIDRYEDLMGLPIALPRGVLYAPRFDRDPHLNKVTTKGHDFSVKMLMYGRVRAITGPRTALYYTFRKLGISPDNLGQALVLGTKEAWLQISKNNQNKAVHHKLTAAVRALRGEGVFEQILARYFATP